MSGLTRSREAEKEVEMAGFASFLCFTHIRSQRFIVSFRNIGVISTDAVLIDLMISESIRRLLLLAVYCLFLGYTWNFSHSVILNPLLPEL